MASSIFLRSEFISSSDEKHLRSATMQAFMFPERTGKCLPSPYARLVLSFAAKIAYNSLWDILS